MADSELIKILQQGSEVWNNWRKQHPETFQVDLRGADLIGTDLSEANLIGADLSEADLGLADLRGALMCGGRLVATNLHGTQLVAANLSGANLSDAILSDSNLNYADLRDVDLSDADLSDTDLSRADLSDAILWRAELVNAYLSEANLSNTCLNDANLNRSDLSEANLSNADLRGATIWNTVFARLDLREARGLAELNHQGPSYVEIYTVQLPQDGSALLFLRGAGVPDEWINFWRATAMHPVQYHSCFISYTHQDESVAHRLHSDLQDHGVRCWFAPHDMKIGDKIRPRIDEAIHMQDKLLLILSKDSVASDWVEHEVETVLARERREKRTILFPIRLDDTILERDHTGWPALVQHERHIGDFTGWKDHDQYQVAFDRLVRDLKKADE